jgi:hypothetical protein
MSHPHTVPHGWEKGEPLTGWENGTRWVLTQASPTVLEIGKITADDVGQIMFDSKDDMVAFLRWWHEGKTPEEIVAELRDASESWRQIWMKVL